MSKHQSQTEINEPSQAPKKDTTHPKDVSKLDNEAKFQAHLTDFHDAIRSQPIRSAKVVSAKFARRD